MIQGKIITQGIVTSFKQHFTLLLVFNGHNMRIDLKTGYSQRDANNSYVVYANSFGLVIVARSCLINWEHHSCHQYRSKSILEFAIEQHECIAQPF